MKSILGRTTHLAKLPNSPNTHIRALSGLKASESEIKRENIKITILLPNNPDHFSTFQNIITDKNIVFTSSWIDKWFGLENLKTKCRQMEQKLKLFDEGDLEVLLPQETIDAHRKGISPDQIALTKFFNTDTHKAKLREIYEEMTSKADTTGLGYFKFEDISQRLLGGGALAPISNDIPVKKVDIALHLKESKKGFGSFFLNELLHIAFQTRGVEEVWGSSIINHPGTPTLCAKHGMIIQNQGGMKYYYIDKEMWEANKEKFNKIRNNPIAASTHYGQDKTGRT